MIDINILNKAIALTQKGYVLEAEKLYQELLEQEPDNYVLLSTVGLFYVNVCDFRKASEYLEKAVKIKETPGTLSALGFAKFEQGEFESAAEWLEKALAAGESADIYHKLIISLFESKSYKKAVEYAAKMFEKYPDDIRSVTNKVKALTQSGKLIEAEKLCVESLKKHPEDSGLWFHLGYLKELIFCDDIQARECYKAALELGNQDANYNIAVSCQKLGEYDEAEKYYRKMLELFPNDMDTMTSLGMCLLTRKKFKEGYDLFFQRNKSSLDKKTNNPWKPGEELPKEVVVMCDQGFGDHIQFIRYIPFIKSKVKVAAAKQLRELFKKNYPQIEFIDYDEINPDMKSLRVTDLAYILDMDFDNIPFSEGYLESDTAEIQNDKLKVGLCWEAGSAGIRTMINRTIHIKCFEPLLNLENIQVYSFQVRDTLKGNENYPQMINLAKDFKDFSDTAKALKAMDVVVTVDTSVAHLAGALGVKTFLLLPYASDWRWFEDTKTTPWYKSVRIFKQTDHISWEEPINNVINLLNNPESK